MARAQRLTPYQRIVRAAKIGVGVRLSVEECRLMTRDNAIVHLAENDDRDMNGDSEVSDG